MDFSKKINVNNLAPGCFGVIEQRDDKEVVDVLIKKGDNIPCSVTKSYFTEYDNQRSINIQITQSNDPTEDPNWVQVLWDGELELPSGRSAGQEVKATYSYDENGVMSASFVVEDDDNTETIWSTNITPSSDEPGEIVQFILDDDV
jgi:molecular chaperone DnaK